MDYKKTNAPTTTVTQNILDLCEETGNIYESVAIIAKRANQISVDIKSELSKKLQEFASSRIASRLKSAVSTRSCRNPASSPLRSSARVRFITAIPPRTPSRKRSIES